MALRIISTIIILISTSIFALSAEVDVVVADTIANQSDTTGSLTSKLKAELVEIQDSIEHMLDLNQHLDSITFATKPWYKQLYDSGFHIHDPAINYPKFMRFALNVYDWGDRVFNSYDSTYVVGTGKNWKAMCKNYNWMESYMMLFSVKTRDMLHIRSNIFNDVGFHLSFMAVSIGYTAKLDNWAGHTSKRSNFNFNFTSSRFSANIDLLSNDGSTKITHFGNYNDGRSFSYPFDDIKHNAFSGEFYYFINHLKYSQAAAYCFSKYQLRSAGSPIVGFAFNNQKISMDFSSLPQEMRDYLPSLDNYYGFRFTDYALIGGYAYNWVIRPKKWLFNITALPSFGFRHSYTHSSEGRKSMLALNGRARIALVYNHRALFTSLTGKIDSNLFFNAKYTFFNSTESLSLIIGARF